MLRDKGNIQRDDYRHGKGEIISVTQTMKNWIGLVCKKTYNSTCKGQMHLTHHFDVENIMNKSKTPPKHSGYKSRG